MTVRSVRRMLTGIVLFAVLAAGCGVRPSGVITGLPAPTGPIEGARLYFVSNGQVAPVLRPTTRALTVSETLALLAAGPDAQEQAQGFTSQIPTGAVLFQEAPTPPTVVVSVAAKTTTLSTMAVDQIVCTAGEAAWAGTRSPGIATVTVQLRGGGPLPGPQTCLTSG